MAAAGDTVSITAQGIDVLTPSSRMFYERSLVKTLLSIIYAALALLFLGFCAADGGRASFFNNVFKNKNKYHLNDDKVITISSGGFGFGTFCHFVAFLLALSAAVIISPFFTGTRKETTMLRRPQEL